MEEKNPFELAAKLEKEEQNPFELAAEIEKKNPNGKASPTGGQVGVSATPSIGSSPFLQKAKQRVEGAPTVLSVKQGVIKPIGQPSFTPTKEEELNAPTQKQFEEQAVSPYENLTPLQIAQKQTKVATERSNALDELIKAKKESQSVLNKVLELDKEIESYEPQFEAFKATSKTFQPDIQAYKNTRNQINGIEKKSYDLILAFNKESETLKPKMDSYVSIFQNDKLPEQKRKEAYEAYSGLFSMLSNKEKLLNKAIADNESSLPGLEEQLLSYDRAIKGATANQKGFSSLYDKYKSSIEERNILANELGGYQKKQEDAQRLIKEKLFEQSNLEDIRQNKAEKEYSTLQNLFESLPKVGMETVAGFADIMNTLGATGDQDFPENNEQIRQEVRENAEKLRKFGDSFITQELPKNYEKFFEGDFSIKKLANLGVNGIASTAPTIVAGLLGGPAAGVVAGSSMAFGESKEIMKEAGLTEEQAEFAALGLSIPIGLLENYGAEDIVKLFSKDAIDSATKIFLKNIARRNLTKEQLFNEAKNTIGQLIKEGAPQLVKEGFKEGLTEPLQGTVNEVAKQVAQEYAGVDLDENLSWSDYLKEQAKVRGEEAIGGFLSGTTMYIGGVALKEGYQAVFPTFNPSAYNKALELLDPNKMEAFKEEVSREVEDKVLTPEQAELAFKNIELIQQTNKLIPNSISNKDLKTEALNLLIEKKDIETEIEGKDEALVSPQKDRIKEINTRLSDIAQGKQEAVVEEQPSQPIITKNTTPTDEKYGTIDRGDGKGVIDLTRAEYEAEVAKQQPTTTQQKPIPTEAILVERQKEKRDAEIEEVQALRDDLGQEVELINDIPVFIDDVIDRIDLGMMVAPEMLSDAIGELDKQFDKLQEYKNDPSRTHTTAQIDAMIDVLSAVKTEIQDYQLKQSENEQPTKTEPTTEAAPSVEPSQEERKQPETPTGNYEIAQEATRVVSEENPDASVLLTPKGEDLSLTAVFVKNEKRNKGVGTKVLESVKKQADKLGKKVVLDATTELDEETDLERLGKFYEANGFTKVGENKFEYNPNKEDIAKSGEAVSEEEAPTASDVERTAKALEDVDKNAWGATKGLSDNFYTTDVDGYAIKKPITNASSVTIDGVNFHIAKIDGDWKVVEKKSGLEISTGKTSNTKNAAIEDAIMRLKQNGGAENLPILIDRAIQGFKDRNTKAVESLLSKEQTPTALRDVESTAKALEENRENDLYSDVEDLFLRESGEPKRWFSKIGDAMFLKSKGLKDGFTKDDLKKKNIDPQELNNERNEFLKNNEGKILSEAYHKAKADGSNPELVKAVESLLSKEQAPTELSEQLLTPNTNQNEQKSSNVESEKGGNESLRNESPLNEGVRQAEGRQEENVTEQGGVTAPSPKTQQNETKTEQEKPLLEGVRNGGNETQGGQESTELRAETQAQEEVKATIADVVAKFYAIEGKGSQKREAAKAYRQTLEKMPTVKNIFDNIKPIFAQLEREGIITKSKECP